MEPCLGNILFIGLEFVEPIFSGNGILTHSLAQGLLDVGYNVSVICAQPSLFDKEETKNNGKTNGIHRISSDNDRTNAPTPSSSMMFPHSLVEPFKRKQLRIFPIPVPAHKWKRLDRFSAWEEMAYLAPDEIVNKYTHEAVLLFDEIDFVFCIDWSAIPTYDSLSNTFLSLSRARLVYYVFRVFSMSSEIFTEQHCLEFYQRRELQALQKADLVLAISHVDKMALEKLIIEYGKNISNQGTRLGEQNHETEIPMELHVIVPPLRSDLLRLLQYDAHNPSAIGVPMRKQRKYIMCNVRISPEKNAIVFAHLMRILSHRNILHKYNFRPLLVGVICDHNYASKVRATLPPETKWITDFLKPSDLIAYMQESVIMIHPSTYEAYGMTIAEAAAVGTPSLIHFENIGASSWFRESQEEILTTDMTCLETISNKLLQILEDQNSGIAHLNRVGKNAQQRALMWTTSDCAQCIGERLKRIVRTSNHPP
jgi:hypothetical protein